MPDKAISEAKEICGLPDDSDHFEVLRFIKKVSNLLNAHSSEKIQILSNVLRQIDRMKYQVEEAMEKLGGFEKEVIKTANCEVGQLNHSHI